jgi:hypothetical protein
MSGPAPEVITWASSILGTEVTVLRGLRHGSSPWLLRAGDREVVLRVARAEQAPETATEAAAMTYAARVAGASRSNEFEQNSIATDWTRLSDPEDVKDDQGLRFVVNTERQDAVLTKLGLAELRLTAARLYLPGVPWLVDQPR